MAHVNKAANEALADAQLREKLSSLGIEPTQSTPEQLARLAAADTAKWKQIITDRKITNE